MTEQFEKAVEIGGLFVTAIQFLFTVTGKDQNRGAIIPDMVQGSRFVDCRLQRFQPSLVAGFEMSDYLTAESPCRKVTTLFSYLQGISGKCYGKVRNPHILCYKVNICVNL